MSLLFSGRCLAELRRKSPGVVAITALTLALGACGLRTEDDRASPAPGPRVPDVAGQIGEREVTVDEVDEWIKDRLFKQATRGGDEMQIYQLRRRALQEMADSHAAEAEAARTGRSVEEVMRGAEGGISDAEVRAYYEANKQRFRNLPYERVAAAARLQLTTSRQLEARQQHADELRKAIDFEVRLEPPRYEIASRRAGRGPANAPITLVEFGDYEGSACRAAEPVVGALLARYPTQLAFHFLHFPRDSRPLALGASKAAECAGKQAMFREMHAALFARSPRVSADELPAIAESIGLDAAKWQSCLSSAATEDALRADIAAAASARVTVTPAFFVNGVPYTGRRTVEGLARAIDEELQRKSARGRAEIAAPSESGIPRPAPGGVGPATS